MEAIRRKFDTEYKGQPVRVALRTANDGYVPGFIKGAAQLMFNTMIESNDLLSDEGKANQFFKLVMDPTVYIDGEKKYPSWQSWTELDSEMLEEIQESFFCCALESLPKYKNSETGTRMEKVLISISAMKTTLQPFLSEQQRDLLISMTRSTT